jgi:ribonuclease-3
MEWFFLKISKLFQRGRSAFPTQLEKELGYRFQNREYLRLALSHRSYTHVKELSKIDDSNERLEFLGDAVLGFVIAEHLYKTYPNKGEGTLSKMRSLIVSSKVLAMCSQKWHLGKHIYLSPAEEKAGGRKRTSILADAFEAVLGGVYLDGGLKPTKKLIEDTVVSSIGDVLSNADLVNYKSLLLEYAQSKGLGSPTYQVQDMWGPEHQKHFRIGVEVSGDVWGVGEGFTKKSAQQKAAQVALEKQEPQSPSLTTEEPIS